MHSKSDLELQIEWLKLEKLINDFEFNEHVLNAVIRRESADKLKQVRSVPNSGFAMFSQQAYEGYSLLIRAYMACNADSPSEQQLKKLRNALEILEVLRQQSLDMDLLNESSVPAFKAAEKARILAKLETTGEVYTAGGYGQPGGEGAHHALIKYTKIGGVYTRTEFNEGVGVEMLKSPGKRKYGWGVNRRTITRKNLEKVISIDVDTTFKDSDSLEQILPLLKRRSKEDIDHSIITTVQTLDNCNTRSVRALLRNVLGAEMLRDLFEVATTQLSDTQLHLAERFNEIQNELYNRHILKPLIATRQLINTKAAKEETAPQVPSTFLDIEHKKMGELCISIIRQTEFILHKKFERTVELDLFKGNMISFLRTCGVSDVKVWLYLKPESLTKIAFIMAENLISNKVIYTHKKTWLFDHDYLVISPTITPPVLAKITLEGVFKSLATSAGAENELGRDQALTECALSIVTKSFGYPNDFASVKKAKLVAVTKTMLTILMKPYRIDVDMLAIIEGEFLAQMHNNLPPRFDLKNVLDNYQKLISLTRASLAKIDKLKPLEKAVLLEPVAKPAVGKLKIAPKLAAKLNAIINKHIQAVNEQGDDSPSTQAEQNQLKEVVSVPSQYGTKPEPYPAFTSRKHLEGAHAAVQPIAKRARAAVTEQTESEKRARVEIPAQQKKRIRDKTTTGKQGPDKHPHKDLYYR